MSQPLEQERIPYLICKYLIGTITDEEGKMLTAWRSKNACNEETFQHLMNMENFSMELRNRNQLDYHGPLESMKYQLGINEGVISQETINEGIISQGIINEETFSSEVTVKKPSRLYRVMTAAAILLLLIGSVLFWQNRAHEDKNVKKVAVMSNQIIPGHTQARLTLDDGTTVFLTDNTILNKRKISMADNKSRSKMNNLSTPRGGEFKVKLEDGTEVWLNAESKLCYPKKFSAKERRVEVSGEAYFKVAHINNRPFYVVSGGQEVRVYGTEFNIHAYNDEPIVYTTLVKGSISLRTFGGSNNKIMLTPGNQVIFDKVDASAQVHEVDPDVVTSWRRGAFVFQEQTMEQIMKTLSRWYNFKYAFTDKKLATTVFMGSIPKYGSFKEVTDIFKKIGGISLRQKGDIVLISPEDNSK